MDPATKRKKLYLEGVLRLGSGHVTCEMKLYPLVTHSVLIRRHVESICENDGSLLIKLRACPGSSDIFEIVQDYCYGLMDENAISVSNVVGLVATSNFLEIDGLACRALKFLEEYVFVSWETCLRVLATFNCNDPCNILEDADEKSLLHKCRNALDGFACRALKFLEEYLFVSWENCLRVLATFNWREPCNILEDADENSLLRKCTNAFLLHVRIPLIDSKTGTGTFCCNVRCLVRVAELLSPRVAEHIYKCCKSEQLGLCFNYEAPDQSEADYVNSSVQIPLCIHFRGGPMFTVEFDSPAADENHGVEWLEDLPELLPHLSGRAPLLVHLAKSMLLRDDVKVPNGTLSLSSFRWSFLCALLATTTCHKKLCIIYLSKDMNSHVYAPAGIGAIAQDLDIVIGDLQRMVSWGLRDVVLWHPETDCNLGDRNTKWSVGLNADFIFKCVLAFSFYFDTLQSVLRHFGRLSFDQVAVSSLAEILDRLLSSKVRIARFTVQQALLIYQEFPNDQRRSHAGIYYVFQESLKRRALCAQDVDDLTLILDYQKLPDEIVEELFEGFQINSEPRLLQRFLAIEENRIRIVREESQS